MEKITQQYGYGVDIEKCGYGEVLKADEMYIKTDGKYITKELVDEIENKVIKNKIKGVNSYIASLNLTKYQLYALYSRAYNCGTYGALGIDEYKRNGKTFTEAYTEYWNKEDDKYEEEAIRGDFSHLLYKEHMYYPVTSEGEYMQGLENRRRSEWTLFQTGYFDVLGKRYNNGSGDLLEAAYYVADYFMNSGAAVHYAGRSVAFATDNGRTCIFGNIEDSWKKPIENPESYGVVCATFVTFAIWQAGYIDTDTINRYGYNGADEVVRMLEDSEYSNEWQKITSFDELQPGDIVYSYRHIWIFAEDNQCLDQNYCVIKSDGTDSRGSTYSSNGYRNEFISAYRYIG